MMFAGTRTDVSKPCECPTTACSGRSSRCAVGPPLKLALYDCMKVVKIRQATQGDRHDICSVHESAALELGATHYGPTELAAWGAHLNPDLYEHSIATQEVVVAEVDGAVVGFGQLNRETGVVEAVYVSPDRAAAGVGASVLNALEVWARAAGLKVLRLDASLNSVVFYERMGYHGAGPGVHHTRGGREIRCVHMRKELVP